MDALVHASLLMRRAARRAHGLIAAAALSAWLALGGATAPLGAGLVLACALWLALLVSSVRARRSAAMAEPTFLADVELGALLAVGLVGALLRFDRGLSGPFSPAIYVLVALVAAFARPAAGIVVVAWVVALEALVRRVALGESALEPLLTHAAFVAA